MKRILTLICTIALFLSFNAQVYAQNVGINGDGSAPNSSAGLDIKFSDKGLLIPRVAINDVNLAAPIATPAEGLLVYNETGTQAKGFYYWNGTKWVLLLTGSGANNAWKLTGNAGTVDSAHFIGTTDNVSLNFKANNGKAGRIGLSGDASVFFGYQAGNADDHIDNQNVGIGYQALFSNTTGYNNVANGYQSLYSNTIGFSNQANGYQSLYSNTTGYQNVANGYRSLYSNTYGYYNTAVGLSSLNSNTGGYENVANGFYALYSNTTGFNNTGVGAYALNLVTTGSNNTSLGYNAQVALPTESNQVRIGNTYVTYAEVQVAWAIGSDRRWKTNIQESPLGLSFIQSLRPVVYTRKNDEKQRHEYGFIAQEVEEALQKAGVNPQGVITINDEGMYSVRYNDFIAPMVKSIQELSTENAALKKKNEELENRLERLEKLMVK
ncbi:MAG TPA: tail fiber domain-containing protein [Chitinophagaceae bacterium]|nr:tail fiber domain-containing protein [Candidatus Parvibacillus calidus]MBX2937084.1 tail fiber domain-containing protein [Saprospiraceae bacterium]HMY64887.1 tail fiber domain-containing protein [Bacteroidia bacterium]HNF47601.1 tail fiber domain-containing protein [Chitinophagaceae bacterium]HNG85106.1 tail fiber domain-containing protein [Bacteroidia bacterium]